jgi:quinol monooxygenase YgiN
MIQQVKIVALFKAKPGKREELRQLLEGMTAPSRSEAGVIRYDLWRDEKDPDRFVIDELYADASAIAEHWNTAHFKAFAASIKDVAEIDARVLEGLDVAPEAGATP